LINAKDLKATLPISFGDIIGKQTFGDPLGALNGSSKIFAKLAMLANGNIVFSSLALIKDDPKRTQFNEL
jgi:hypothetical protein